MDKRVLLRIDRLVRAHKKLSARYVSMGDEPKKDSLGNKLLEIEASLKNLKDFGRERIAGSGKGLVVEVPVRDFNIRGEK